MSRSKKIVVALSGGVDSSVAAYLLKKQNPSIPLQGIFMNNWSTSDEDKNDDNNNNYYHNNNNNNYPRKKNNAYCAASERDYQDAEDVCKKLDIPLRKVNFSAEYWTQVFEPFLEGLENGITPNPDIWCNSKIKFGVLKDYAMQKLSATGIATGHYARVWDTNLSHDNDNKLPNYLEHALNDINNNNDSSCILDYITKPKSSIILLAAKDLAKDQTYFLCQTPGTSFQNVHFPIGDYIKQNHNDKYNNNNDATTADTTTIRSIALNELGLRQISKKRESFGICFIGKRNFQKFIPGYVDPQVLEYGVDFIDVDTGKKIATHNKRLTKTSLYTIGQRAKISGLRTNGEKWYIVDKYVSKNIIWVCNDTNHPALYCNELYVNVHDMNWICGGDDNIPPPMVKDGKGLHVLCRTRHLQPLTSAEIYLDTNRSCYAIKFDNPIRAITPGQSIALYVAGGLVCLGGGSIWDRGLSYHERGLSLDLNSIVSSSATTSRDLKNHKTALDHLKDLGLS